MDVWWTWCRMQVNAGPGRVVDRRLVLGKMWKRLRGVVFSGRRQEGLFMRDRTTEGCVFGKGVQVLRIISRLRSEMWCG